jgi:hypothetical protein
MVLGDAIDEDFQRINNTWQPQFFGDHNACSYALTAMNGTAIRRP